MAVQSTYSAIHAVAFAGMEAEAQFGRNISRTVETAAIGYGKAVSQGTGDHGILAYSSTNNKFIGVTVRDQAVDPNSADTYAVGGTASVKIEGAIWVVVSASVAAGDPVYLDASGNFTNVATNNTLVARASFRTTAASSALALLRLQ